MAKYSKELRLEVVMAIENGESIKGAARKFNINVSVVRGWWRRYSNGGVEQLISTPKKYSSEFKLYAIDFQLSNGLSYPQAASELGIPNHSTLYVWGKLYLEKAVSGLQDTKKGRPAKVPKKYKR